MWNIFYDGVLRLKLPEWAFTVGFADDLALLVINHTTEGLKTTTNQALILIDEWITRSGLTLAHRKTEAVMLTRKWAYRKPILRSGGLLVPIRRSVKYLGVTLDSKLSFTAHVKTVSVAAVNSAKAIGRLLPNIGGPSAAKRALLASVVSARLLYAAPVWAKRAFEFAINTETMDRALRIAAIRIARCYRTVSTPAALFLAGTPRATYWHSRGRRSAVGSRWTRCHRHPALSERRDA